MIPNEEYESLKEAKDIAETHILELEAALARSQKREEWLTAEFTSRGCGEHGYCKIESCWGAHDECAAHIRAWLDAQDDTPNEATLRKIYGGTPE